MSGRTILTLPMGRRHRQASPEIAATAVYDGRNYVGSLVERPSGQVEACPAAGGSLGLFNSPQAAAHALLAARTGSDG